MSTRLDRVPSSRRRTALGLGGCLLVGCLIVGAPVAHAAPKSKRSATHKRHAKRRPHRRHKRRDIFARAPQVLDISGKSKTGALTSGQVAKVMQHVAPRLEPCLVLERRRNPELRAAFIEFVISARGRVLATRVNKKRYSSLAKCVHRKLRVAAHFPKSKLPRQVAGFRMRLAQ